MMSETDKLLQIKDIIEAMNKTYQLEILKLFVTESSVFSGNNNGVFINLTELDAKIIYKLEKYIDFVYKQQNQLETVETQKDHIKDEFFNNNIKNHKYKSNKATKEIKHTISGA